MTKTWTYNDIVRLNLGYLKPNTNSYKHSEVLKSFLSKIDKKQTKRYNAFLTQYINADAKKYNEKKAKNTLIKLQSQWNYIQYNAISEKKKIKKKSKITVWPLIFVKTARSKLKNSLKIKNKNINNFQNPKELTHLLNTILTFSNKNKTATTSVKCQPIKSLNFFFEKKKKILPNRFAMTRSAIREERLNSQRIKYIKNYGHTKRINTKKK